MREHVCAVHDGSGLREEDVVQLLVEDRRTAARRLDERVVVAVGHRRRGSGEERREGPERESDLVLRDQVLVVRDDLVRARRVVDDLQLDLVAQEPAVGVDDARPELVAALRGLARVGEVAGERERDPDLDRARRRAVRRGRSSRRGRALAAATAARRGERDGEHDRDEREGSPHRYGPPCRPIRPSDRRDLRPTIVAGGRAVTQAASCHLLTESVTLASLLVGHESVISEPLVRADRAAQGLRADRRAAARADQRARPAAG